MEWQRPALDQPHRSVPKMRGRTVHHQPLSSVPSAPIRVRSGYSTQVIDSAANCSAGARATYLRNTEQGKPAGELNMSQMGFQPNTTTT